MTLTTEARFEGPVGIGGWMILPILGMIATIGFTLKNLIDIANDIENMVVLLTNDTISLSLKVGAASSVAGAILVLLTATTALIAIFRRSPSAPRAAMIHFGVLMIAVAAEFWVDHLVSDLLKVAADETTRREALRTIFYAPVWIAYFAVSRRVRNTFRPNAA